MSTRVPQLWPFVAAARIGVLAFALATLGASAAPPGAEAAVRCPPPTVGRDWRAVAPERVGLDPAGVRAAVELGTRNGSFAIRVYRHGCRVGEDGRAASARDARSESWSLAKSVTALVFGRAMTLGLIGPDDPLGSLIREADAAHGRIKMRHLLTMTSGLRWNGLRDYNVFMPNRLREALTVPVAKRPGTYWEYSQSGPALLAEAVSRAVGEDFQDFAQRELFGPLGIDRRAWHWTRDGAGHTQGFTGLNMKADDFARLGELMRRGGVWRGKRLLSRRFVSDALTPIAENGCYGWLIWLNASKPCVGPRILDRPVDDERNFPGLPSDMYTYSGLFGQWVAVFPSQGVVIVRTGIDGGTFTGNTAWQEEMYRLVLDSITDDRAHFPRPAPDATNVSDADVDHGFIQSLARPLEILQGELPPRLPPAGPARTRALILRTVRARVARGGTVRVRFACPPASHPSLRPGCRGIARLRGARGSRRYSLEPGRSGSLRFRLRPAVRKRAERGRGTRLEVRIRTSRPGPPTRGGDEILVAPPG